MKKIICLVLGALLIALPALAAPKLDDGLFDRGKEVMNLTSYGEFDRAFETGGFADGTAEDFASYMQDNFYDLFNGTVQQDVAVCYYDGTTWTLAIPVLNPTDDSVETLMLTAADGKHFDGYACASWGDAVSAAESAEDAVWSGDYQPNPVIVEPDEGQPDQDQPAEDEAPADEGEPSGDVIAVPDA
jgi:hypothetical protein